MRQSPLLLSILAALSGCSETFVNKGCFDVPAEQTSCPAADAVEPSSLYLPNVCGDDLEIGEVLSGGKREELHAESGTTQPACCYRVEVVDSNPNAECAIGRPYFDGGTQLQAPLVESGRGTTTAEQPRALAWAKAGAGEHASVAAFSRLALQLLALGAPHELLRGVHQAALDELRHAEQCWALARGFGAKTLAAGAFPFPASVRTDMSLAELAAAAVRDGCLAETLGAHLAAAAAELAPEADVRAALRAIAVDEAQHAVLSFKIAAWAFRVGGAPVRAAVDAALSAPWPKLDIKELALRSGVDVDRLHGVAQQGVTDVLGPAVEALTRTGGARTARA